MTQELQYQVYLDGKPAKKIFKAKYMDSIWTQFNKWAKSKGATEYIQDTKYIGEMAWKTKDGIAEVRKVSNEARGLIAAIKRFEVTASSKG
jgi:hypothetical protein